MSEPITVTIDKSGWGAGEWQNEPDRLDFIHAGFACMALRHTRFGHWCGYVGVPREHPYYGKPYDEPDVEFHGGLTYANRCNADICHVPEPGMPDDVWWLGGDFAHCNDMSPGINAVLASLPGGTSRPHDWQVYRALPYVRSQIEGLAEQLKYLLRAAAAESPASGGSGSA